MDADKSVTATFSAPVAAPTITSVTPLAARLDFPQDFIVTGTNLTSNMGFTVEDCETIGGAGVEVGTGTNEKRTFRCTPRLPGLSPDRRRQS